MVSIGRIKIRRIIEHHILPPIFEPIVKGPAFPAQVSAPIPKHVPLSLMPPGRGGGTETSTVKHVSKSLVENVTVGAGTVAIVKTPGVTGFSYTQTSFTFTSYTMSGIAVTKTLTENVLIDEPLTTARTKQRAVGESDITESSDTTIKQRAKARGITETVDVTDELAKSPETRINKTLSETIDITEGVTAIKTRSLTLIETVLESEEVALTLPGVRITLTEVEDITDSVAYAITYASGHIAKDISQTVDISDSVVAAKAKTRAIVETDNISDNVIRHVTITLTSFTDTSFTQTSYTVVVRNEKSLIETEEESHTVRIAMTKNRGLTEDVIIVG